MATYVSKHDHILLEWLLHIKYICVCIFLNWGSAKLQWDHSNGWFKFCLKWFKPELKHSQQSSRISLGCLRTVYASGCIIIFNFKKEEFKKKPCLNKNYWTKKNLIVFHCSAIQNNPLSEGGEKLLIRLHNMCDWPNGIQAINHLYPISAKPQGIEYFLDFSVCLLYLISWFNFVLTQLP